MLYTINLSSAVLAGFAISLLGTSAGAQLTSREPLSFVQSTPGQTGLGAGTMVMPTQGSIGLLTGVLVEEKAGAIYTLDAKLTTFIPNGGIPLPHGAFGGLYGQMRQVPEGGLLHDDDPILDAYVEGQWSMQKNLFGVYQAFIYERSEFGSIKLLGVISGQFRVSAANDSMPFPQHPSWDTPYAEKVEKGALSDSRPGKSALDSADVGAEGKERALDDASGGKKPSDSSGSAKKTFSSVAGSQFDTPNGTIAQVPSMVGVFNARFKLLD